MRPFRIEVPEAALADLRVRLRDTRWPERETVEDWSQGVPRGYLRELCGYWAEGYDWRATEARLNALPQFRTELDGLAIHFIHVRSARADALPLVLTHGWPGSVVEFLKVIGPLADSFHVVCPSLPGYGFSDKPAAPGWGVERIAGAWAELMARLGHDRYLAAGSDWGTSVSACLGRDDPQHVAGIHLVPPLAAPFGDPTERSARRSPTASAPTRTPATRRCMRPARRRSATASWTRPWRCARGSSRSCGRGRTVTTRSRATRSSTR